MPVPKPPATEFFDEEKISVTHRYTYHSCPIFAMLGLALHKHFIPNTLWLLIWSIVSANNDVTRPTSDDEKKKEEVLEQNEQIINQWRPWIKYEVQENYTRYVQEEVDDRLNQPEWRPWVECGAVLKRVQMQEEEKKEMCEQIMQNDTISQLVDEHINLLCAQSLFETANVTLDDEIQTIVKDNLDAFVNGPENPKNFHAVLGHMLGVITYESYSRAMKNPCEVVKEFFYLMCTLNSEFEKKVTNLFFKGTLENVMIDYLNKKKGCDIPMLTESDDEDDSSDEDEDEDDEDDAQDSKNKRKINASDKRPRRDYEKPDSVRDNKRVRSGLSKA